MSTGLFFVLSVSTSIIMNIEVINVLFAFVAMNSLILGGLLQQIF
jgi:hypothetical protein